MGLPEAPVTHTSLYGITMPTISLKIVACIAAEVCGKVTNTSVKSST